MNAPTIQLTLPVPPEIHAALNRDPELLSAVEGIFFDVLSYVMGESGEDDLEASKRAFINTITHLDSTVEDMPL